MIMISVIVPVYNAGKYLRRCIDSILAQTYTDFELLLIDDGSTDDSPDICDEYVNKCKWGGQIRAFHKPNGGASSARNLGLQHARGEYIVFVDADDWVDATYLEEILPTSPDEWIISSITFEGIGKSIPAPMVECTYGTDVVRFLNDNLTNQAFSGPCCKAYCREVLEKGNIRFREEACWNEDLLFVLDYLVTGKLETIHVKPLPSYHYFLCNENSLTSRLIPVETCYFVMDAITERVSKINEAYGCDCEHIFNISIASCMVNIYRWIKSNNVPWLLKPAAILRALNNPHFRRLQQEPDFINTYRLSSIGRVIRETIYSALKVYYFFVH